MLSIVGLSPALIQPAFAKDILSCGYVGLPGKTIRTVNVANEAQFKLAIKNIKGGDTIRLAPGKYGAITLNGFKPATRVTFVSANPAKPAVIGRTLLNDVRNISFENLKFSWGAQPKLISPEGVMEVRKSSNVHVLNSSFTGGTAPKKSLIKVNDGAKNDLYTVDVSGHGTGTGIIAVSVTNLQVRNSSFKNLTIGTNFNFLVDSKLVGNTYEDIAYDAIDLGGVKKMLVEGNWVKNMSHVPNLGHRDLIQLRAFGEATDTLVIKNNVMIANVTGDIHGIYMGNAKAKAGGGKKDYYKNIHVTGNTIGMRQALGIAIGHSLGVRVANNTIMQLSGTSPSKPGMLPKIVVGINSEKVSMTGNKSHQIHAGLDTGNWNRVAMPSSWTYTGNKAAPANARVSPPHLKKAPGCGK